MVSAEGQSRRCSCCRCLHCETRLHAAPRCAAPPPPPAPRRRAAHRPQQRPAVPASRGHPLRQQEPAPQWQHGDASWVLSFWRWQRKDQRWCGWRRRWRPWRRCRKRLAQPRRQQALAVVAARGSTIRRRAKDTRPAAGAGRRRRSRGCLPAALPCRGASACRRPSCLAGTSYHPPSCQDRRRACRRAQCPCPWAACHRPCPCSLACLRPSWPSAFRPSCPAPSWPLAFHPCPCPCPSACRAPSFPSACPPCLAPSYHHTRSPSPPFRQSRQSRASPPSPRHRPSRLPGSCCRLRPCRCCPRASLPPSRASCGLRRGRRPLRLRLRPPAAGTLLALPASASRCAWLVSAAPPPAQRAPSRRSTSVRAGWPGPGPRPG